MSIKKIGKLSLLSLFTYLSYQYFQKAGSLIIQYDHSKLKEVIKLNPSLSKKKYYPSFFFPGGEIQTFLLLLMNRLEFIFKFSCNGNFTKTRKVVKAGDGEYIFVEFFSKSSTIDEHQDNFENFEFIRKFDNSDVIVFIPGACGRSGEFYITDVMQRFLAENFKCIAINHRGILKYPLQNDKLYHSGYTDDVKEVFEFLRTNVKGSNYYLIGFSMGGNIVTKFIGENCDFIKDFNIKGGVSVCGPLDLKKFQDLTEIKSKSKLYSRFFFKNLKSVFDRNSDYLLKNFKPEEKQELLRKLKESKLASHFYKEYILKSFGFESEEEYQIKNSGTNYIQNIKIPFLCIFAKDDPLIPLDSVEGSGWEKNENFVLAHTSSGGHVGFFKGFYFERWIYEPILEFIRDVSRL
jgi:predicted alpha/beta-fold hydrolase